MTKFAWFVHAKLYRKSRKNGSGNGVTICWIWWSRWKWRNKRSSETRDLTWSKSENSERNTVSWLKSISPKTRPNNNYGEHKPNINISRDFLKNMETWQPFLKRCFVPDSYARQLFTIFLATSRLTTPCPFTGGSLTFQNNFHGN